MKEEYLIKETKEKNGNKLYNNKDLLFYIVGRVDKLDDKLDSTINSLNLRINKKLSIKVFTTIVLTIIGAIGTMFKFLYSLIK